MVAYLRACGGQQTLLRRAAAHRAGAQVRNEGPGAENRRRAGFDGVDVDQSAEALGPGLGNRAGEKGGPCSSGLTGRQQQHRHAAFHRDAKAFEGVGGELERRNDEAVRLADEWARAPCGLASRDRVQHRKALLEVFGKRPARADVLGCPHQAAIQRVDVEFAVVDDVPRHAGPLEHVNVLTGIDDARHIVEILRP